MCGVDGWWGGRIWKVVVNGGLNWFCVDGVGFGRMGKFGCLYGWL